MEGNSHIRVLVADEHEAVREGVRFLLEQHEDIQVVGEAPTGRSAAELTEELSPDVVLLDLVMPDQEGVETIRRIKGLRPATHVVVLTSSAGDDVILRSIRAGALSYLRKDVEPPDLVGAVRAAARGERVLGADLEEPEPNHDLTEGLTPRELEVLGRIARGQSNREIAQGLEIGEETVKTHVSNVLAKLHMEDRTQAAIHALRRRLVQVDDVPL
jgi:NarL family two-component system response regulator LiaR